MNDYSSYDLAEGFVLSQHQAIEFLRWGVAQEFEQAIQKNDIDCTTAGAFVEDAVAMAQVILDKDWEWVMFSESPMSASGININEMKEA